MLLLTWFIVPLLSTVSSSLRKYWARVLALPGVVWRLLWVGYFIVMLMVLAVRFVVLPQVTHERARIEAILSRETGLDVRIGAIEAEWTGLHPRLELHALAVVDRQSRQALSLPRVDAELGWSSLLFFRPILHRLDIYHPQLAIRREVDGSLFVAGIKLGAGGGGNGFAEFVLNQPEILIHEARLSWTDAQRKAPTLVLDRLSLRLDNDDDKHRFALLASPPAQWSERIDVRGNLRGRPQDAFKSWRGTLYLSVDHADLAAWKPWVDYPVSVAQGRASLRAWLNVETPKIAALTADLALADLSTRLADDLPDFRLRTFSGRIRTSLREGDVAVSGERLQMLTGEGEKIESTSFSLRSRPARGKDPASFEFNAGRLELGLIAGLASRLPLPAEAKSRLQQLRPRGQLDSLALFWQKNGNQSPRFKVDARFAQLGLEAMDAFPGVRGVSGQILGDERQGSFHLNVRNGALDLPRVMPEPIRLDKAAINGGWSREKVPGEVREALRVQLDGLQLSNPDTQGEFSGFWRSAESGPGYLDLRGSAQRARATAAIHYMPLITPAPVVAWIAQGLKGGRVDNVDIQVKGDLREFPFRQGGGIFRIGGNISEAEILFAEGWLGLKGVQGKLLFEGSRMLITARTGYYLGAQTRDVRVEIPDMLDYDRQVLKIDGKARGVTSDFLHYVSNSKLAEMAGGFTRGIQAQGHGDLGLHIEVPLAHAANTKVSGEYRFAGNQLKLVPQLPEFSSAAGVLSFTEAGLGLRAAEAVFLGRPVRGSGQTERDGTLHFVADGSLSAEGLRQLVALPANNYLRGETPAHADIRLKGGVLDVRVGSSLQGLESSLPAPLRKPAQLEWPLNFSWHTDSTKAEHGTQNWQIELDHRLNIAWEDRCTPHCDFARGFVAYGTKAELPAQGWRLAGQFDRLDADPWRALVAEQNKDGRLAADAAAVLAGLAFETNELIVAGHRFHDVVAKALRQDGRWSLLLKGPQLEGNLVWSEAGRGMLLARLKHLTLDPLPVVTPVEQSSAVPEGDVPGTVTELPGLDVIADKFQLRKLDLGRLELSAVNADKLWRLQKISLISPDFRLEGRGLWRGQGMNTNTHLDFELDSDNVGAMLDRLGYPGTVRDGKARLKGVLDWRGPPSAIHYPTLSGSMTLQASHGRFNKLEPGAGRLLGLLSLQFLPNRLSLDFRDLFAEGFAFDSIKGNMSIRSGVMQTQDLEIKGASALVKMRGTTDLGREVHDLHLIVQPTLTETVAVGVVVGQAAVGVLNPVAGLAAYLAQKVLSDPVEKMFSYEYDISGTWSDPQVEKAGSVLRRRQPAEHQASNPQSNETPGKLP